MDELDKAQLIVYLVIFSLVILFLYINEKTNARVNNRKKIEEYHKEKIQKINQNQIVIERKIQEKDPRFNKEKFIEFSKQVFIKVQQAWTNRDFTKLIMYETQNLFEQHKNQIQAYIKNNQINKKNKIHISNAYLYRYEQEGNKEILQVKMNVIMADYIIDATTKRVIKGDKSTEKIENYLLTFIRQAGEKTNSETLDVNIVNCPNCGAEAKITAVGKCEYCGSTITTDKYNWLLSNLEEERVKQ